MNDRQLLSPLNDRFLTFFVILVLSVGIVWGALSLGWDVALGVVGFSTVVILSFISTRFLILATILVFTLNHANLFGSALLLQNARWFMLGLCTVQVGMRVLSRKTKRKLFVFDFLAITGLLFALFSTTYSGEPSLTFQRTISLVLLYVAVFWLSWDDTQQRGEESIVQLLIIVGILIFTSSALLALFPQGRQSDGRVIGIMPNPNALGLVAAIYTPLLAWGWLKYKSFLSLLSLILAVLTTVLSGSRNGFLGVSLSLVYLVIFSKSSKFIITGVLVINVVALLFFLGVFDSIITEIPTLSRIFNATVTDYSNGRFDAWADISGQIADSWLYGYGFGLDPHGLSTSLRLEIGSHNTYLQNAYQLGVLGTLIFIIPLFLLAMNTFKRVMSRSGLTLTHVLHAVLISGLVSATFENWIYSPGNAFTFPFWACIMLLLYQQFEKRGVEKPT